MVKMNDFLSGQGTWRLPCQMAVYVLWHVVLFCILKHDNYVQRRVLTVADVTSGPKSNRVCQRCCSRQRCANDLELSSLLNDTQLEQIDRSAEGVKLATRWRNISCLT